VPLTRLISCSVFAVDEPASSHIVPLAWGSPPPINPAGVGRIWAGTIFPGLAGGVVEHAVAPMATTNEQKISWA